MKRFTTIAVSFVFAAIFAVSAFAQVPTNATKIGWIDTGSFGDEKDGVTKYRVALSTLDAEMKPRITKIQGMQARLTKIEEDLKVKTSNSAVPVNQQEVSKLQEEGQGLQRTLEFEKKEYAAVLETSQGKVLGPVSADIGRAIQEFAKQKGYAVILDIDKLGQAGVILALDQTANITKEFVVFYNARPATTASTAAPR